MMTTAAAVPCDLNAEESLLGAMMLSPGAVESAVAALTYDDFYKPDHQLLFRTIVQLYRTGQPVDPQTVLSTVVTFPGKPPSRQRVYEIHASTPASANADAYIEIVIERADRRRLLDMSARLTMMAQDLSAPVDEIVTAAKVGLDVVQRAGGLRLFPSFAEWSGDIDMHEEWLVPGILERRDRVMLIAPEGFGKSHCLRNWAIMCAAGVHWFTERPMPPMKTLIIDVENSARQIVRNTLTMHRRAQEQANGTWDPSRFVIVPYSTLDLTKRSDRLHVESYIAGHRPDMLVIGPLYKILPPPGGKLSYEEAALQGIHILDDWRARYGVALMIEHHAPKGSGGHRELDPLGSSAFMRWPEFGLTLSDNPEKVGSAKLGHFRMQRERRAWPQTLERGGPGQWSWRAPDIERDHGDEAF